MQMGTKPNRSGIGSRRSSYPSVISETSRVAGIREQRRVATHTATPDAGAAAAGVDGKNALSDNRQSMDATGSGKPRGRTPEFPNSFVGFLMELGTRLLRPDRTAEPFFQAVDKRLMSARPAR